MLLATQHPHCLLKLAVKRCGLLDWHADALRDGEQFLLRDRIFAAACRGKFEPRRHHVPGVGDLNDLLHLAHCPVDAQEGQQLRLGLGDLIAKGVHSGLDLGHSGSCFIACSLGAGTEPAKTALGRSDSAFKPFVRAFKRDEDGNAFCHLSPEAATACLSGQTDAQYAPQRCVQRLNAS